MSAALLHDIVFLSTIISSHFTHEMVLPILTISLLFVENVNVYSSSSLLFRQFALTLLIIVLISFWYSNIIHKHFISFAYINTTSYFLKQSGKFVFVKFYMSNLIHFEFYFSLTILLKL